MRYNLKKWDRIDTFAFTFGGAGLFAGTVIELGLGLAALFTVTALIFSFVLWLRA